MHLHATGPETAEAERFGLLVRLGFVSREEVAAAAAEAGRTGESVASILVARYGVSKHSLGCALQAYYRVPFIAYDRNLPTEREAAEEAGAAHLRTHRWVPLLRSGRELYVLTDDPSAAKAAAIRGALPGRRIRFFVGLPDDILAYIIALEREGLLRPARDRRRDVLLALALLFLALGLQKDGSRSGASALRLPPPGTLELIDARPAAAFTTGALATLEFPQRPGFAAALHKADLANHVAARSAPAAATTAPPPPLPAPHLGKGELVNAAAIAAASGAALEEVLALRESGLGWGVIAQSLGSTLGRDRQAVKGGSGGSGKGGGSGGPGVGPKPGPPAQPPGQAHGKAPKIK